MNDPDALLTVDRVAQMQVVARLCPVPAGDCRGLDTVFTEDEPISRTHTVGVYLDEPVDVLAVQFTVSASPTVCQQVIVPFDGVARAVRVTLADGPVAPTISGCDDCVAEECN